MSTAIFSSKDTISPTTQQTNRNFGLPVTLQKLAAITGLLLFSPILLSIFIVIKLESKGPAIYRQIRVGEHGRRFYFYKFRSMYTKDDARYTTTENLVSDRKGTCQKFKKDPRVTKIGRIIRKLSLDELPQLYNVIKGDMLLIGPRPALCRETDAYNRTAMARLSIKPGITGLWQVSGRANTTFDQQIEFDIQYINNRSWLNDVLILLNTIPAVISCKGAY